MGAKDITQDDLLGEVAAWLMQERGGRPGPEWFTQPELYERCKEINPELTFMQLRHFLKRQMAAGKMERYEANHQEVYYRKLG